MAKYEHASPREISTQNDVTYIAIGPNPYDRLESVANAHTAADLHVRPGLTTRWFQGRERCERPKRYDQASFPATKNSPSLPCENNLAFRLIGTRFSRKAARF